MHSYVCCSIYQFNFNPFFKNNYKKNSYSGGLPCCIFGSNLVSNGAAQISVLNGVDILIYAMCTCAHRGRFARGLPKYSHVTKIYYECNTRINLEVYKVQQQELEDMQSSEGKKRQ